MTELKRLEDAIARDLQLTHYPGRDWVLARQTSDGQPILDVLIIGGGQSGLAAGFGLIREKVSNILIVDQNPENRAGPWLNFARMKTLRTPKYLTGPDLGLPNLTIQAWYEAIHGAGAWEELGLIPKETWVEYLAWYRKTLELPIAFETRAGALSWDQANSCFRIPLSSPEGDRTVFARRVVLATGIEGSGDWHIPSFIKETVPSHLRAHTREDIDFDALRGKRIGILGAGASAFDNASVALETGAASVDLFFRRPKLVNVNPYRWAEFVGFLKHVGDLDDAGRWAFIRQIIRMGQLPPADTYARARQHDAFTLHPGSPWTGVSSGGDTVRVEFNGASKEFDFIIVATGFRTDLSQRPELAEFVDEIALWSDRFVPPEGESHDDLLRHPYLSSGFAFEEKTPGNAPFLKNLYNYTFGCLLSLGFGGASISGMKYSIPRLVGDITRSLFAESSEEYLQSLCDYQLEEF